MAIVSTHPLNMHQKPNTLLIQAKPSIKTGSDQANSCPHRRPVDRFRRQKNQVQGSVARLRRSMTPLPLRKLIEAAQNTKFLQVTNMNHLEIGNPSSICLENSQR